MEGNLTIVDELRAKLAEKPLDTEMIADLKARLAKQPPDEETAEALRTLLMAQALDEEMMQALTALQREYMPEPPRELSDDELDNVVGGCGDSKPKKRQPKLKKYPVVGTDISDHFDYYEVTQANFRARRVSSKSWATCPTCQANELQHEMNNFCRLEGYPYNTGRCKKCEAVFVSKEPIKYY